MSKWLSQSTDYRDRVAAAKTSPSRSVAASLRADAEPLVYAAPDARGSEWEARATRFLESTLARAASTVAAWTGDGVTASTTKYGDRGSLIVSAESILRRGEDPDAAADYATGRLLIAASQREYLLAREREAIDCSSRWYARAARDGHSVKAHAADYAAGHLAATVATIRGREKVLNSWPGWAGYFGAAEADRATPEAAAAFVKGPAPAIVRASFALSREAEGLPPIELPADIEAMVNLGRPHLHGSAWTKGTLLDRATAVIAAMTPPPDEMNGEGTDGGEENGEDGEAEGGGSPSIPGSDADSMMGDRGNTIHAQASSEGAATAQPVKPGAGKFSSAPGCRAYPVVEGRAGAPYPPDVRRMVEASRPLLDALRRIAWESNDPPTVDHAQTAGELDEGAMHRLAAWNDPRVFDRRQEQGPGTVAVELLIDCSGSMGGYSAATGSRLTDAQTVAYAMATAFRGSRFSVSVAGHCTDYCNPKYPRGCVRYWECPTPDSISRLCPGADNADGYAIAHALDKVSRRPAARRAVFLIADGQPSAQEYGGTPARNHIRGIVNGARARGIDFLAIGVAGTMRDSGPGLFGSRFVSLPDVRSAGPLLGRIIGRMAREAASCA